MLQFIKNNKRHLVNISVIVILLTCTFFYSASWCAKQESSFEMFKSGSCNNYIDAIKEGDVIEQEFLAVSDEIRGVSAQCATFGNNENKGTLVYSVIDKETGEVLYVDRMRISAIGDNEYVDFRFEKPVCGYEDKVLIFRVEAKTIFDDTTLTILLTDDGVYGDYDLYVNGETNKADMRMNVRTIESDAYIMLVVLSQIALAVFILICYFLLFIKKKEIKLEKLYIVVALFLGLLYMLWIIPFEVPDEKSHIITAYELSNTIMFEDGYGEGEQIKMRYCDRHNGFTAYPDRYDFDYMISEMLKPAGNTEMIETDYEGLNANSYLYIFSAIGLSVGRLLGMNVVITFMLGRLFNLIAFITIIYWAIKKIPFGKVTVFVIATLPITIQQGMSFSYDCLVIALSIFVVAMALRILYSSEHIRNYEYILYAIAGVLLAMAKSYAYVMLPFIICIGLYKYSKNDKEKFKKILMSIFGILITIAVVNVIGAFTSQTANAVGSSKHIVSWSGTEGYTISYFLENPLEIITVMMATVFSMFDSYLYNMMGGLLGWLCIGVPWFVVAIYIILLLASTVNHGNEVTLTTVKDKCVIAVICFCCFTFCLAGLLFVWTPLEYEAIQGVQGRYFLPFLLPSVLLLKNNNIHLKKNIDRYIIFGAVILQAFVLCSLQFFMAYIR